MGVGTLWYCLLAAILAAYVVFDGYDLGAGVLHLFVARTDGERRQVLQSIGPLWDGNEVWLVTAGGTLLFAFPRLYAASFSGFYLALMMVLWLLILRGLSLEFRSHVEDTVWRSFWDAVFAAASGMLALVFGVALGNVVRGVELDASGNFFLALWTDFGTRPPLGALDWYTTAVGLLSLAALTHHGALWVALRTEGEVNDRARRAGRAAWTATLIVGAAVTVLSFRIQPQLTRNLSEAPWGAVFPALALGGLVAARALAGRGQDRAAFLASAGALAGMLGSAAFGIYPNVLPSARNPANALTIDNTLAGQHGLEVGLRWWIPGMALAVAYVIYVHRKFSGKVEAGAEGH
jgi:cytochrome d ubiquinol oxidase subunit II